MDPHKVVLPLTCSNFFDQLLEDGTFIQHHQNATMDRLDPKLKVLLSYSERALKIGRPLRKCLIVMFGQTGAGKSTTINKLFEDELCPTNSLTSDTRRVTQYSKRLLVRATKPSVEGCISLVDVPGTIDVDQSLEAVNFAKIQSYREHCPDLENRGSRGVPAVFKRIVRNRVYPNLVLLVISATDNRLIGPGSNLSKTLRSLGKMDIVDKEHLNLLVVVTNAYYFPKKVYTRESEHFAKAVQEAVYTVLRVKGVNVHFVENRADDHTEKAEASDFWPLPDGKLSHLNVMEAMSQLFNRNGDLLGSLLAGWYFDSECPDKANEVITRNIEYEPDPLSRAVLNIADRLSNLGILPNENAADDLPVYYFSVLGHGYCPVTETVKHAELLVTSDYAKIEVDGQAYQVPSYIRQTSSQVGTRFQRLSYGSKDLYQQNKARQYGLHAGVNLVVKANPEGRWVHTGTEGSEQGHVSMVFERRLTSLQVPDPGKHLDPNFVQILNSLPFSFDEANAYVFNEFFSRFGTHLVAEQALGGEISYDCKVNASNFNEYYGMELKSRVGGILDGLISGHLDMEGGGQGLELLGVREEYLEIRGGQPPVQPVTRLCDLTPDLFSKWQEGIPGSLVELDQGFKLVPYYELLRPGPQMSALRIATTQYLENKLPEREIIRRNEYARRVVNQAATEGEGWKTFGGIVTGLTALVGLALTIAKWIK